MTDLPSLDDHAMQKLETVGGAVLVTRMIDLFMQLTPQRLENARNALAQHDYRTAERMVHSLKSSAANIGALRLQRDAANAEALASKNGDEGEFTRMLDGLHEEWLRVQPILEVERSKYPSAD